MGAGSPRDVQSRGLCAAWLWAAGTDRQIADRLVAEGLSPRRSIAPDPYINNEIVASGIKKARKVSTAGFKNAMTLRFQAIVIRER